MGVAREGCACLGWSGRAATGDRGVRPHGKKSMPHNTHRHTPALWTTSGGEERRVQDTIFLPRLTVADGEWLKRGLPALQRRARAQMGAVRVEDVMLRYRSGRLGIADAMDATAEMLAPFAAAGADLERRGEWHICDEDEEDDDDDDEEERPARLADEPDEDLLVSLRMVVDAAADDAGAAALHWAALALSDD